MNYLNDSVSLYFYSAVFQGNMAVLALIGVFVVFRLQQLANQLQSKEIVILNYIQGRFDTIRQGGVPINYDKVTDIINELEMIANNATGVAYGDHIQQRAKEISEEEGLLRRLEEYSSLSDEILGIKRKWKFPFILILCVILLALIFLAIAFWVHTNYPFYEMLLIAFTILLNIFALVYNAKFIFSVFMPN